MTTTVRSCRADGVRRVTLRSRRALLLVQLRLEAVHSRVDECGAGSSERVTVRWDSTVKIG